MKGNCKNNGMSAPCGGGERKDPLLYISIVICYRMSSRVDVRCFSRNRVFISYPSDANMRCNHKAYNDLTCNVVNKDEFYVDLWHSLSTQRYTDIEVKLYLRLVLHLKI